MIPAIGWAAVAITALVAVIAFAVLTTEMVGRWP
jgi:hypothetical protein